MLNTVNEKKQTLQENLKMTYMCMLTCFYLDNADTKLALTKVGVLLSKLIYML